MSTDRELAKRALEASQDAVSELYRAKGDDEAAWEAYACMEDVTETLTQLLTQMDAANAAEVKEKAEEAARVAERSAIEEMDEEWSNSECGQQVDPECRSEGDLDTELSARVTKLNSYFWGRVGA